MAIPSKYGVFHITSNKKTPLLDGSKNLKPFKYGVYLNKKEKGKK